MERSDAVSLIDEALEKMGENEETATREDSPPTTSGDALGKFFVCIYA